MSPEQPPGAGRQLPGANGERPTTPKATRTAVMPPARTWLQDAAAALAASTHGDPHTVLGAHRDGARWVVRAFHPGADAVTLLAGDGTESPMPRVDESGLFALATETDPGAYRLRLSVGGTTSEVDDPYRFLPTVGDLDIHLFAEGQHHQIWRRVGARAIEHGGVPGVAFAVWAPNARGVRVVGDFDAWHIGLLPMRRLGSSGLWELFVPRAREGDRYKYEVHGWDGTYRMHADPYARGAEAPPATASVVTEPRHGWADAEWIERRQAVDALSAPMTIYEVHAGSWRRGEDGRLLTYRELAEQLPAYCRDMGFTHVELLPIAEHPFAGSWGYQVTGYYAPTARFGTPDDFRLLVDELHRHGIGVLVDWVPAHFPTDDWALARFDGTALYEHLDPRRGYQPDWGTYMFNFGRNEVRNFITSNARYWVEEFHVDGLRVDAVAAMLYLDYSRQPGQWIPNPYGGRENSRRSASSAR